MKDTMPAVCKYCGKSLNGIPRYHRHHEVFCDVNCATLWDYSDLTPIPQRAKEEFLAKDELWTQITEEGQL